MESRLMPLRIVVAVEIEVAAEEDAAGVEGEEAGEAVIPPAVAALAAAAAAAVAIVVGVLPTFFVRVMLVQLEKQTMPLMRRWALSALRRAQSAWGT